LHLDLLNKSDKYLKIESGSVSSMTSRELAINELLQMLSKDYANGKFVPILEADVVGYLYHLWISKFGDARKVHLDTRICIAPNQKFDFVIGEVEYGAERPCIRKPEIVIEVKSFSSGFTSSQRRIRYSKVEEHDIPKLAELKEPLDNRYILLFDEANYLKKLDTRSRMSKLKTIIQARNERDPKIKIIYVERVDKHLEWKLL
jgi:hypothetical protein